jgi:hypothetical protein
MDKVEEYLRKPDTIRLEEGGVQFDGIVISVGAAHQTDIKFDGTEKDKAQYAKSDIRVLAEYLFRKEHIGKEYLVLMIDPEFTPYKSVVSDSIFRNTAYRFTEDVMIDPFILTYDDGRESVVHTQYLPVKLESAYYTDLEPYQKRELFVEKNLDVECVPAADSFFQFLLTFCKAWLKPEGQVIIHNVAYWDTSGFRKDDNADYSMKQNVLFENMCELLYIAKQFTNHLFIIPQNMTGINVPFTTKVAKFTDIVKVGEVYTTKYPTLTQTGTSRKTKSKRFTRRRKTWRRRY